MAVVVVLLHLAGRRRPRVAPGPLGPDQGGPGRLHRRRAVLPDGGDDVRRGLVLRHPQRRLPRRGLAPADRDRLRGRRGDERLPAREHRHVRDAAHVRGDHPRLHVRRGARRLPRAEDLLHDRRDVRLPLPLPLRPGSFDENLGNLTDHPVLAVAIVVGGRLPARPPRPHLLAPGEEALGAGEEGRRHPLPAEALLRAASSCPRSCRGSAS